MAEFSSVGTKTTAVWVLERDVKTETEKLFTEYAADLKKDEQAMRDALQPGQVMPTRKNPCYPYTDGGKAEMQSTFQVFSQRVADHVAKARKAASAGTAKAPSDEALRAVEMLAHVGDDRALFESVMAEYGDNVLTAKAIEKLARDHGIYVEPPAGTGADEIDRIDRIEAAFQRGASYLDVWGSVFTLDAQKALVLESIEDAANGDDIISANKRRQAARAEEAAKANAKNFF